MEKLGPSSSNYNYSTCNYDYDHCLITLKGEILHQKKKKKTLKGENRYKRKGLKSLTSGHQSLDSARGH